MLCFKKESKQRNGCGNDVGTMKNFPFSQKERSGLLIREFSRDVNSSELVWHRDRLDRKILVREGKGWMLQMENELPFFLKEGKTYYIPKNTYHRVLKGDSKLVVEIKELQEAESRKPRKKGQHRGSSKHDDLYTDEEPRGTIKGLGFKDAETARKGVAIINKAKRTHAHKVQATLVMQQRAKVAKGRAKDPEKKKNLNAAYKVWTTHLEKLKKKTKKANESSLRNFVKKMLKE